MVGKKNKFPLEKILSIDGIEYCKFVDKNPSDYSLVGIQIAGIDQRDWREPRFSLMEEFAEHVPEGAEVVVKYSAQFNGKWLNTNPTEIESSYFAQGTALIPKKKK